MVYSRAHYCFAWKAKCPRCSKSWTNENYECKNCGNPEIRAHAYGSKLGFGCPKCEDLTYPKCGDCGANLSGVAKKKWFT